MEYLENWQKLIIVVLWAVMLLNWDKVIDGIISVFKKLFLGILYA